MTRARILDGLLAVCFVAALVFSRLVEFSPDGGIELAGRQLGAACLFQGWTNVPCPFCGLSRSMVALAHGGLRQAFSCHPLGPFVATLFIAFVIATVISTWHKNRPIIETRAFSRIILILVVASLSLWAISSAYYSQHPKQLELLVRR